MLMLWELLFFLRKSLQFYQMLYIIYLLFTDGFPSGQRGQTVNLLAPPSKVRIFLHPLNFGSYTLLGVRTFFCVKRENRKGAQGRAPLHTPRACLKKAFCKMCVTICGRFLPDEGAVAGYGNRIRVKYTAKWGVQIAGMIFKTRSRPLFTSA